MAAVRHLFGVCARADRDHLPHPHPQGHVVADVQLPLPVGVIQGGAKTAPAPLAAPLDIVENSDGVNVTGADGLRVEVSPTHPGSVCRQPPFPSLPPPPHADAVSPDCRVPISNAPRIPHALTQVAAATGSLTRWSVGGADLLQAPVLPLFFRAPTDNDRGGSGGNSHANRCVQIRDRKIGDTRRGSRRGFRF